ncbi:MAG: DUF2065 domain-containing protein [Gammaproteobacteria bacterium]|nr:DUF2065 domain-containing protein [Gammaproteobacteria bacterium]MCY4219668.1 DUF2065 domain-containing protein [Gammaproteobacteria bacterium]MCY4274364.1 DUF2065 domain-containing protein [Gammaproteobacteria bacterium]
MINWDDLLAAFALFLILEGLLPFLNPPAFKDYVERIATMANSSIRIIGFVVMAMGLGLLYFIRS